MRHQYTV